MKNRNPFLVFVFSFITLGIYYLVWLVKTKNEMNKLGAKIPTAWILIIPIIGYIWWYWLYSKGAEQISGGKINGAVTFILLFLLNYIGAVFVQDSFNTVTGMAVNSPDTALPTPPTGVAPMTSSSQPTVAVSPTPTTPTAFSGSGAQPPVQPQPQTQPEQQPDQSVPPQNPPLVSG